MSFLLVGAMSNFLKSRRSLTREIAFPLLASLTVLFWLVGYPRLSLGVKAQLDDGLVGAFGAYIWCAVLFAAFSAWLFNGKPKSEPKPV